MTYLLNSDLNCADVHDMKWSGIFWRMLQDETGGEVLEYALIAGLIVVGAIGIIGKVGTKIVAKWTSLNSSL